jgi:hypothetical protein
MAGLITRQLDIPLVRALTTARQLAGCRFADSPPPYIAATDRRRSLGAAWPSPLQLDVADQSPPLLENERLIGRKADPRSEWTADLVEYARQPASIKGRRSVQAHLARLERQDSQR